MGKLCYFVELLNKDTNICIREQLSSPFLNYQFIVDLIEQTCPNIDLQTITVYYLIKQKWLFLLENDSFNMENSSKDFQKDGQEQLVFYVRFHCNYFLEQQKENLLSKDIEIMSQKVTRVQQLYRQIKDKYKQQPLDINVFWGSPLFDIGSKERSNQNKKMISSEGKKLTLLNHQVKHSPFINAITTALEGCNKNVRLYLKHLNKSSFSKKNIFTIVYLIAHLETDEQNDQTGISSSRERNTFNIEEFNDSKNKNNMKKQPRKYSQQSINIYPPKMIKEPSDKDSSQIYMVIEETKDILDNLSDKDNILKQQSLLEPGIDNSLTPTIERYYSFDTRVEKEGEQQTIDLNLRRSIFNKQKNKKRFKSRSNSQDYKIQQLPNQESKKWYFLGEQPDGSMCKLRPSQLGNLLSKKSRNIELLILHTSYPYHHLQQLRKHANQIILINSNPLQPEASTIFYLKQLFTHIIEDGNIEQAYNRALEDLNTLKEMNFQSNERSLDNNFTDKDVQFIKSINQRYVHGSLDCCCCYHLHHPKCHSVSHAIANRYSQYHSVYHTLECDCPIENLNIHRCESKRQKMIHDYKTLAPQYELNDQKFYYCCCQGKQEGFYNRNFNNIRLQKQFRYDEGKDIHSLKQKYKYQKINIVENNQLQISDGRLLGDSSPQLFEAFRYVENNPLIGNQKLIIRMLQIFTKNGKSKDENIVICNLFGDKSTGCKTIAHYFGNLLLTKKIFKKLITKRIKSSDCLKDIIQNICRQNQESFLLIIVKQDKDHHSQRLPLKLNINSFIKGIGIIFITKVKMESNSSVKIQFVEPQPFQRADCINYVKKYRHLSSRTKKKVQTLFKLTKEVSLYPCMINQFQILTILKKIVLEDNPLFCSYQTYTKALQRISSIVLPLYLFLQSLVKFTKSPQYQKDFTMAKLSQKLSQIKRNKKLFYKQYNTNLQQNQDNQSQNRNSFEQQLEFYYEDLISTNRIRDNYYLIYLCLGDKLVININTIFKMFINHTTLLPPHNHWEDNKVRKKVDSLRMKTTAFSQQIYEATTVNPDSYIFRYFYHQLSQIQKIPISHQNLYDLEDFIYFHAQILEKKRNTTRKLTNDIHLNVQSKDKQDKRILQHSMDKVRERLYSKDSIQKIDQLRDIPHIHHLASIMQGGLQCLRSFLCTHFVYNLLSENQRIQLFKYGIFLINNCIILMKDQNFNKIQQEEDEFDIECTDQVLRDSLFTQNFFHSTHNLEVPNFMTMKSTQAKLSGQNINRSVSMNSQSLFNAHRTLLKTEKSSSKLPKVQEMAIKSNEELLSKQLYRLSTYKGLLYLLDQLERRAEEIEAQAVIKIKIQIQLMAIQIRFEQLHLSPEEKNPLFKTQDVYLKRILRVFNQKEYNIKILQRILKEQIFLNRLSQDVYQLSLIKSYVIVAIALMTSYYGRYKIIKAESMINEIDMFLLDWNYIPVNKRESQHEGNEQQKLELSKIDHLPSQFKLMRCISENQSVYLYIVQSFSATKFWSSSFKKLQHSEKQTILIKKSEPYNERRQSSRKPDQIEIFIEILQLYHKFILPNTKDKFSYYQKLEYFQQILRKKKEENNFYILSTYIFNFVQKFQNEIAKQLEYLSQHLIICLNASDGKNYIKISLHDKLNETNKKINNKNGYYYFIEKKLNQTNIRSITINGGCKYLCLFTNTISQNIFTETNDGHLQLSNKKRIVELIGAVPSNVIFLCLPKKKHFAQLLLKNCNNLVTIIYFDFHSNDFQIMEARQDYHHQSQKNNFIIFEKMIMIESVKHILANIIQEKGNKSRQVLYQSFMKAKDSLKFVLKDSMKRPIMSLSNEKFQHCIFFEDHLNKSSLQHNNCNIFQIEFFENQHVNKFQLDELQHICSLSFNKQIKYVDGQINNSGEQDFRIQAFSDITHFIDVFSYYLKNKYGYDQIFNIHLQNVDYDVKKLFLQKLVGQNILDLIFSDKKGIIAIYVQVQDFSRYIEIFKECQMQLRSILENWNMVSGKRNVTKLIGRSFVDNKKLNSIYMYFFKQQ